MEFDRNELLGDLRARARQAIAGNLVGLKKVLGGQPPMSLEQRAGRPWDLLAKAQQVGAIMDEEKRRSIRDDPSGRAEDNSFDAIRHARASRRVTKVVGPTLAAMGGYGVEALGLARNLVKNALETPFPDDPRFATPSLLAGLSAAEMDLHNNAEGRRAALRNEAIRPGNLQNAPRGTIEYEGLYDRPAPRLTGTPPR